MFLCFKLVNTVFIRRLHAIPCSKKMQNCMRRIKQAGVCVLAYGLDY